MRLRINDVPILQHFVFIVTTVSAVGPSLVNDNFGGMCRTISGYDMLLISRGLYGITQIYGTYLL